MRTPWQTIVQPTVEEILRTSQVPGMVIALTKEDGPIEHLVLGTDGQARPLRAETIFPVASITKLATALAILRLVAGRDLSLDDPLERHLPDAAAARNGVTLQTLLSHTSGLPYDPAAELAPYTSGLDWPTLAHACLATPLDHSPRTRVTYSNVGFGLLAIVVERVTGHSFSTALTELVLAPLGIEGYLGLEPPRSPAWIVGELGEHVETPLSPYNSVFWRRLSLPWGGLVTTASGALVLVRAFAGIPADFLPSTLLAEATHDQTNGLSGGLVSGVLEWPHCPWGLGVELRGDKVPHFSPAEASPTSFGHAGASGCLAWCDQTVGVAWTLLGCRTFESWWQNWSAIGAAILGSICGLREGDAAL
jgi:CubicO group peptidase (beta-lactamase class C family)